MIPLMIINLPSYTNRKEKMIQQTKEFKCTAPFFVEAVDKDSPIIEWLLWSAEKIPYNERTTDNVIDNKSQFACFLSHLKALKTFISLENDSNWGIICEDDIRFHKDFEDVLGKLIAMNKNSDSFVALSYYGLKNVSGGKKIEGPFNVCLITQTFTGAYCYLVSKKSAIRIVEHFDKPFRHLCSNIISSENIVRTGCSIDRADHYCVVFPPLAIEDSTDSAIRTTTKHHKDYFRPFENKYSYNQ